MFPFLGSLIGAGASLLGGAMSQSSQADINRQNVAAQEQINSQNIAEQEKFAQQGVQWKVADAKAAGINPLAALGASTGSFSNVVAPQQQSSGAYGTGVAKAGQDISRAISATRDPAEQAVAVEKTRLDLERGQLENALLKKQIMGSSSALSNQGGGAGRMAKGQELTTVMGPSGPMTGPSRETEGWSWLDPVAKEQYFVRNQLMPWFGANIPGTEQAKRPGSVLAKNPFTGSFYDTKPVTDWLQSMGKDYFGRYGWGEGVPY